MSPARIGCGLCGLVQQEAVLKTGETAVCARCGSALGAPKRDSLRWTAAFSAAALLLYGPANVLPIVRLNFYGAVTESTVWQGCVKLYRGGDEVIALIVFLASIVIPLIKLLGLFLLSASCWRRSPFLRRTRTWLYRVVDSVGRWAMLDVLMLAIIVAVVRLRGLASVVPGRGALAFACVVILTLLAAQSFDPRLIWVDEEESP